jgi:hypothetical protein
LLRPLLAEVTDWSFAGPPSFDESDLRCAVSVQARDASDPARAGAGGKRGAEGWRHGYVFTVRRKSKVPGPNSRDCWMVEGVEYTGVEGGR